MGRVADRLWLGTLLMLGTPSSALATWDDDTRDFLRGGHTAETVMLFAGFDIWRNGLSGHAGLLWAPQTLTRDGFLIKLLSAGGAYRYRSGGVNVIGVHALDSIMAGYRLERNGFELRMFVGPDFQYHRLSTFDFNNKLQGMLYGVRVNAEAWWQPVPDVMVAASASGSTIGNTFGARAAFGWRFMDHFFAGPEIETFTDFHYRQYRVGAHVTAFRTGDFEWSLGGGYAIDNNSRSGAYGRFGVLTRR